MKSTPALELFFHRGQSSLISVAAQLQELYAFARVPAEFSPLLRYWLLASETSKADALRYEAFDDKGPSAAALAVVTQRSRGARDIRSVSLWNGAASDSETATLSSLSNVLGGPDTITLALRLKPAVNDWQTPVAWLCHAASIWHPCVAGFGPYWYGEHKVFADRPGVSWMFYLPRVLTAQQVPEAAALVPVMAGVPSRQTGTIIVSVTDGPFSSDNPEHVRVANAIEIRLADQDLLPRYGEPCSC